jgi:hypothetical protein
VHLPIDRHKENESAFDIPFTRIDKLRHDTLHDRNAARLPADSVTCRSSDTGGGTSFNRPL